MKLKHCLECGAKLILKPCGDEGDIPFCESCGLFRFPVFSTAISTAVLNHDKSKILLIQQYNRPHYILLAGYVNKGEDAEATLVREVKEEVGLQVTGYQYMRSEYYEPNNTLMLNFVSVVDSEDLSGLTAEVDHGQWFTWEEAVQAIAKNSLAERFLLNIVQKLQSGSIHVETRPSGL
ncbi:NAD(+) diphosphatase [Paenibacillus donghaensis]|uniref:NAD(+) diphosphatase n=1 Tax=Paenibacillus donghaensis TaxID=414771 RepID=UPI001FEC5C23|nr:NUDIX domain-containing protein [Paenibacillus donghaensis]